MRPRMKSSHPTSHGRTRPCCSKTHSKVRYHLTLYRMSSNVCFRAVVCFGFKGTQSMGQPFATS